MFAALTLAASLTVIVPEDRAGTRTIALNVVVIPALRKRKGIPPLFHLDGGPGIAATNAAPFYIGPGSVYREWRDIVLIDQRGTGGSNPLRCPALEQRPPSGTMYSHDDVVACRDALQGKTDLTNYSTEHAAEDIESVRKTLGYPKIDIWALSYGTRLAQEYIKRFPARVRRVVLAGFVPLDYRAPLFHAANAQRVLDLLLFKCQSDDECARKYPALREDWKSASAMRSGPLAEALRTFLGTAAAQRELPAMIHAAAGGDVAPFLGRLPKDSSQFAEGLYLTIVCSEGVSRIDPDDIERHTNGTFVGDYRVREEVAACANWPKYPVQPAFYEPPKSSPPILVLAGEMDQVAPPDWGRDFCSRLPQCQFVLIPDLGHGPFDLDAWTNGSCFDEIAVHFYDRGGAVDTSCLKDMRPPEFQ